MMISLHLSMSQLYDRIAGVVRSCCRCNKTGKCRNCPSVKAGIKCLSCLPGRLGHCENLSPSSTHVATTIYVSPSPSPTPSDSTPSRLNPTTRPPALCGPLPLQDVNNMLGDLPEYLTSPSPFLFGVHAALEPL